MNQILNQPLIIFKKWYLPGLGESEIKDIKWTNRKPYEVFKKNQKIKAWKWAKIIEVKHQNWKRRQKGHHNVLQGLVNLF